MHAVVAILSVLFNNGLVIWGLGWDGWSGPTALAIYWGENAIGTIFIALRIWLHRRLTCKRGHYRNHLGLQVSGDGAHAIKSITDKSFFAEYLTPSVVFPLGHGVFVLAIFALIFKAAPDDDTMRWALLAIGLSQLFGFLFDLVGLRSRSFAWLKLVAGRGLARVLVVQLAIIFGMALAALTGRNAAFGIPFAGLKLLVDLGAAFATEKPPQSDDGPPWLIWIMKKCFPKDDFAAHLRGENAKRRREMADDELPQK
ncbi:MAG: hypothetical protein H0T51_08430 [Pirellulales bacterium]|nr:hypothetical protein [Pirellulales bacterium]